MPIHYLPNDPFNESSAPIRQITPSPNRPSGRAGLNHVNPAPAAIYPLGTPGFLHWQCREAALKAIEVWEDISGPFKSWQPGKTLRLIPDAGEDLNAFYDRNSLAFFHATKGSNTFYAGASTDVVAHEDGHGFLDAIRPDFWYSNLFEVNSFHEAFGDCIALLTALYDPPTRSAVRADLTNRNFVEGTAEDLSRGVKTILGSKHNAAAARRARNRFNWALPSTLPEFGDPGDGPGRLISETHSFAMIFSGCFYDTLVNIFAGGPNTDHGLRQAAKTAGELLVGAARNAPQKTRYFREIGRHMMIVDQHDFAGANQHAIRTAFANHGIALGSSVTLSTEAALSGPAPKLGAKPALSASVRRDLSRRLGLPDKARLKFESVKIGGQRLGQVTHQRAISLGKLSNKLRGVVALAPETVLVGSQAKRATLLGSMPDAATTRDEVESFVQSLIKQGAIGFGEKVVQKPRVRKLTERMLGVREVQAETKELPAAPITHRIKSARGKKVLVRLRFACCCHK